MRCFHSLSWSNLLVSFAFLARLVHGLQISIEERPGGGVLVNQPTTVRWASEPSDPVDFDFRFVVGQFNDVGLAAANIKIDQPTGGEGSVQLNFPRPGNFVIKAVSGPQFTVIGTSNEVEVKRPESVLTSASTPTTSPSTSTIPKASESTNGSTNNSAFPATSPSTRSGVIAGIVIGTLALILIIGLLIFFWHRRRALIAKQGDTERRISFHPEQMVQSRRERFLSIGRFTLRTNGSSQQSDVEQGIGGIITPFPSPLPPPPASAPPVPPASALLAVPASSFTNPFTTPGEPPMRPLPTPPPNSSILRPLPTLPPSHPLSCSPSLAHHLDNVAGNQRALPTPPRTERQQQVAARLTQVKDQIRVLKRNSMGLDMVMEDLSKQVKWLEENSESDWARGLTDVPPSGFARYMTP